MINKHLTPHFTLHEMTKSFTLDLYNKRNGTSYVNDPDQTCLSNLTLLCERLETIRLKCGGIPIVVTSGYRNTFVNNLVGGARKSLHLQGLAADVHFSTLKNYSEFFYWAVQDPNSFEVFPSYSTTSGHWIHFGISTQVCEECKIGIEMEGHLRTFYHNK